MSNRQNMCACGCGQETLPRRRYVHGHNRRLDPVARFWACVQKTETCWLWTGPISNRGYGHISVGRKTVLAHRFAYELLVGPIPEGLTLDHVHARGCRSKACVNPGHLEPVTAQENQRRAYALITHCPQGHEYTSENMLRGRRECRQCNREAALRRYHARKAA